MNYLNLTTKYLKLYFYQDSREQKKDLTGEKSFSNCSDEGKTGAF